MKVKMTKAEATRFFKSLLGSGSGAWEVTAGREYAIRNGQIVYSVELVDNWPFGEALKLMAFIADKQIVADTLFDRGTHLPWDEEGDKKKMSEKVQRAVERTRPTEERQQ